MAVFAVDFTVGDDEILVGGDINVVGVAVGVPEEVIFEGGDQIAAEVPDGDGSVAESQE